MKHDITSILNLTGFGGRLLLGSYGLATTLIAVLNLHKMVNPIAAIAALLLLWGALFILALPSSEPFSRLGTTALIVLVAAITALGASNLRLPESPGYSNWHMGATTFVLLVLALRGRPWQAWFGYVVFGALEIGVTTAVGDSPAGAFNDVARQAATLLVGSLFALLLRRASRTITAIQASELERVTAGAATAASAQERELQVSRLERFARPALDRILSDEPLTPADREHFELLEATLRDGIRAGGLSTEELARETRDARARGVHVVLLDDRGQELTDMERELVERALTEELRVSSEGMITARLSPFEHDEIATIVVEERGQYRRVVVSLESIEVTHLN